MRSVFIILTKSTHKVQYFCKYVNEPLWWCLGCLFTMWYLCVIFCITFITDSFEVSVMSRDENLINHYMFLFLRQMWSIFYATNNSWKFSSSNFYNKRKLSVSFPICRLIFFKSRGVEKLSSGRSLPRSVFRVQILNVTDKLRGIV